MLQGEQLCFLQAVAPESARYKAVATISPDAGFRQEFYLAKDVAQALNRCLPQQKNTFLSLCDYQRPKRSGESLFGFTAFGFDIDCHASEDPYRDALQTYDHLQKRLFDTQQFPQPTQVLHTGRGLLVIIAFERAPKQVLSLWLRLGEVLAQKIRDALPACATLDDTYRDVARVVRVPGSYNTSSQTYAQVLYSGNTRHTLKGLREQYLPDKPHAAAARAGNLFFTDHNIKLHQDRLSDLIRLVELRKYHLDGLREKILFLYRYWTCFYLASQGALLAAMEFNRCFTHPLAENEVRRATRSAETAFERWKSDKLSGYNYRNDTLIQMLGITLEEQAQLKTIISKDEKARRRAEKGQWGNAKRDQTRKDKRQQRDEMILNAISAGMSVRDICQTCACSPNTVQKIMEKAGISKKDDCYHFGRSTYYLSVPDRMLLV